MFDVDTLRLQFPALDRQLYGKPMVYFDNAATSQTPRRVIDAVTAGYLNSKANVHRGVHTLSQEATALQEEARRRVAAYIGGVSTSEVIFTRGTTEAINLVAASYGSLLGEGDEILLTVMEHHANIVPWQLLAARKGLTIKVAPILPDGSLDIERWKALFSPRTRLAAFCHVSNVLGTVNPVAEMCSFARSQGAVTLVDGAQAAAHTHIDVKAIGADFYAFSSHKMYGPNGVGVLYGREQLLEQMPPWQGGGEMIGHVSFTQPTTFADLPYKFEAGTPDFIDIAALPAAIDFIEETGMENIAAHEHSLLEQTVAMMTERIPGLRLFGTAPDKDAVISFLIGPHHHYDVGMLLDKLGVEVRTGHHCAQPLMQALGIEGTVRASFAAYNTPDEARRFVDALARVAALLG